MYILAGDVKISDVNVTKTFITHNNKRRASLQLDVGIGLTPVQITALQNNPWRIYDEDNVYKGEWSGYHVVVGCHINFCKDISLEEDLIATTAQVESLQEELVALEEENAALFFETLTSETFDPALEEGI